MKRVSGIVTVTLMVLLVAVPLAAAPVGTSITYQGKLISNGGPVNEATSMAFSLWDDPTTGTQRGATLTFDGAGANPPPVGVADGLFTVQLDFGVNPYADNAARWLEISINGTPLSPRQPLSAAPFALNTRGLAVDGSGRVGIGTPTPGEVITNSKLDVVGGHVAVSNNYGLLSMNAAGNGLGAGMDTTHADELEFYTNGARRVHIDATGKVGIGTTNPTSPLSFRNADERKITYWESGSPNGLYGVDMAVGGNVRHFAGMIGKFLIGHDDGSGGFTERMRVHSNGNVGIGVTAPTARLHTVGGPTFSQVRFEDANPLGTWVNLLNTDAGGREFGLISTGSSNGEGAGALLIRDNTAGIVRMMVDPAGNVGIGTIAPTEALDVVGNIRATGSVFAACGTLSCSDERFKTNIEPVADALTVVEKLQPVHYDWKRDEFPERHFSKDRQVGLIAQDVRKVAPEVVRQDEDGYLAVDYGRLTPLIVSAIKQVKSEKDDQIASLHAENAALKARLDRLESMLGKAAK